MIRYSRIVSIVAALGAPLTTGCNAEEPPAEAAAETGSISAAISTVGPDGATYSFPTSTYLIVTAPTWTHWFPIDGSGTTFFQNLPPGDYTLQLNFPSGEPSLVRTDGTITSEVAAVWTDAQPVAVHIDAGVTTPVVLHFDVAGLGDITFVDGTLQVEIQVDDAAIDEQASQVQELGSVQVNGQYDLDPGAPYALELATVAGSWYYQGLTLQALGPWQEQGTSAYACMPVQVVGITTGGDDGVGRRMRQLDGAQGTVCISDAGATDYFIITVTQSGAMPADQWYLSGPDYTRTFYVYGGIGDVYDGVTLRQTELSSWVTPPSLADTYFSHDLHDPSFTEQSMIDGYFGGSFRLRP